jgi:class 3 adenylate cyclase
VSVCAACGQENPENARFCLRCGSPLVVEAVPREERRIVSIIFVDVVGFTRRSEQLDPEDVRALLRPYYETVRSEIESFGGVVEKFIGDAVMGVFGAPTSHGDDPERAVRAALSVRDALRSQDELQVRIAVNTGEAIVTLDARPGLGEAMVAGDVVNTAARLQQTAAIGEIVVGEETYAATRDAIEFEPAAPVVAKGKAEPISAWHVRAARSQAGERQLSAAPLVGRDRELAVLEGIWERVALERHPHLVTVLGAAGVGKSRLGVEFARSVEVHGGRIVRGRALPYREHSAYGAFATQVKQLAGIYDSDDVDVAVGKLRAAAGRLLAESEAAAVAGHLAILLGFETAAAADRETLFFSARIFIEAVARDQATMLVFEDVHWADGALLDLIELLAARLHDLPILMLTTARHELLDSRPTWGGGLLAYSALPLEPLGSRDALELAERLVGDEARTVVEAAEGNPLFIEQLAAVISERGGNGKHELPTTIRGLVSARLDALPAAERALLLDAAVVGKVFWRGGLERLGDDPAELPVLLSALERRDLIRREATSAIEGDEQYAFKHVLIRDVAYELLPRERRRRSSELMARFVEDSTPEVGEAGAALARLWREAGNGERAIDYFVAAAEEAERGWAKGLAVDLYREALELASPADEERRRSLRRRLAVAQQAQFHIRDAQLLAREPTEAESPPG